MTLGHDTGAPFDVLRLLPEERPAEFDRLPTDEQAWRGRYFLMVYALDASEHLAWASALDEDPEAAADVKALVERTPDYQIVEALRLKNADGRGVTPDPDLVH